MCFEPTIIQENGNGCLCRYRSHSMQASLCHPYGIKLPGQWTGATKKPSNGERVYPHTMTYVKKMELSETIGVTLKDEVWCWTSDTMLVAEVTVGVNSACVFIRTLYPC